MQTVTARSPPGGFIQPMNRFALLLARNRRHLLVFSLPSCAKQSKRDPTQDPLMKHRWSDLPDDHIFLDGSQGEIGPISLKHRRQEVQQPTA
jgi:hypothetical protein